MDVNPFNITPPVFSGGGQDFETSNAVIVQQETNMLCRCCCCQPNIDFKMQDYAADSYTPGSEIQKTWAITEDAPFLGRCVSCCCHGARPTAWTVRNQGGETVMSHEKGWTCSHCPTVFCWEGEIIKIPWCCCLPYLDTFDERHNKIGSTKYVCDQFLFVPKFDVLDTNDRRIARIRPDTCCFDCCIRCRVQQQNQGGGRKRGRCRVPFVVRKPEEPFEPITLPTGNNASITDMWAGLAAECCTRREVFSVAFPPEQHFMGGGMQTDMKKILVGSTLLVQMAMFEHEG